MMYIDLYYHLNEITHGKNLSQDLEY